MVSIALGPSQAAMRAQRAPILKSDIGAEAIEDKKKSPFRH